MFKTSSLELYKKTQLTTPVRVLHVIDKLSVDGSGIHGATKLLDWLTSYSDKDKFQFSVCSLRRVEPAGEIFERNRIPIFFLGRHKFDPRTLFDLLKLIEREQPDILHLHGYGAANFGRIASLLTGIPNVVHEHAVLVNQPFYQTIIDGLLSPLTTKAIAVSTSVKDFMIEYRSISENCIEVIRNGVPLKSFQSQPKTNNTNAKDLRAQFDIPENHMVVGIIGRLNPIKGHQYFIEAASQILQNHTNVTFLVVGEGELKESLEELAQSLGVAHAVKFTGYREDIPAFLSIIDIVAIASLTEGGPLVLIEAMAAECAVVSTNTIGLKDAIVEGETGYLVPPQNSQALAEKIAALIGRPSLCKKIAEQAQASVFQFDISETVKAIEKCYAQTVKSVNYTSKIQLTKINTI
ncbi:glycosyltransferase [Capilliphycus salinus ALCB114379]|uniref:glycosyltransferase n=1 Tax=Capilliphycus salinus TaxID=2768948 RepID=UPI0039A49793